MDSLVQTPRRTEGAAGHRLCVYLRQLELLEPEVQFSQIWDSAGFIRRFSVGTLYRTIQDLDDGFGDRIAACREYTFPRDDPESEIKLWIEGHTRIGPVLRVKTTCYLNVHGIEIQIPSTSGTGSRSWVVISRGPNRYVDELQHNDPDHSPENFELADHRSTEQTYARQPTTHSRFQYNPSEHYIPISERNWICITSNEYCKKYT